MNLNSKEFPVSEEVYWKTFRSPSHSFTIQVCYDANQTPWFLVSGILHGFHKNSTVTNTMKKIASEHQKRVMLNGKSVYLVDTHGAKHICRIFRTYLNRPVVDWIVEVTQRAKEETVKTEAKAENPYMELYKEIQSLKASVEKSDTTYTSLKDVISNCRTDLKAAKIGVQMLRDKIKGPDISLSETHRQSTEFTADDFNEESYQIPADPAFYRKWIRCIVDRLGEKAGGGSETIKTIWNTLMNPIEKEFNVNLWDLCDKLKKEIREDNHRPKSQRKYSFATVNRMTVIELHMDWMQLMLKNVYTMAMNAGVNPIVNGIDMLSISYDKNVLRHA